MSRQNYNPGYTGFPALFFLETLHQDRGEKKLIDRMWSLHARYSYLNAWMYDAEDTLRKEIAPAVGEKMSKLRPEIDAMFERYDAVYEGESCSVPEKEFLKTLRVIRERIDTIASASGIIDRMTANPEEFVF